MSKKLGCLTVVVILAILGGIIGCVEKCQLNFNSKKFEKLYQENVVRAKEAYRNKDYFVAVENYKIPIDAGWKNGEALYEYAQSLREIGSSDSENYFFKAKDSLKKQYNYNHRYITALNLRGKYRLVSGDDDINYLLKLGLKTTFFINIDGTFTININANGYTTKSFGVWISRDDGKAESRITKKDTGEVIFGTLNVIGDTLYYKVDDTNSEWKLERIKN